MQDAYARNMEKNEKEASPRRVRRRARLLALQGEVGGPAQLERETGTPKSYFSAIASGTRGMGDELAAKLEKTYNKPVGWFDMELTARDEPQGMDLDAHTDLVSIRAVKLRLQAGVMGFQIDAPEGDALPIFFRSDWLAAKGLKPYNLVAVKVRGPSMENTLYEGDMVVINTADTEPKDGAVFAVNYEGEAVIKRITRDNGAWWLSSDNPDQRRFPRKECVEGSCIVVGRVIHRQSEQI